MTSDAYADVTPDDSTVIPDGTTADLLEQHTEVTPADGVQPELSTEILPDVNPADAVEQQTSVVPADAVPTELPLDLPDDVNPADALDQALSAGGPDDDR